MGVGADGVEVGQPQLDDRSAQRGAGLVEGGELDAAIERVVTAGDGEESGAEMGAGRRVVDAELAV